MHKSEEFGFTCSVPAIRAAQQLRKGEERGKAGCGRGRRWLRVSHRVLNRVSHKPPTAFTTVPTGFSKAAEKLQPERKPIETMEKAIEGLWKTPIENPMENPPQSLSWKNSSFIFSYSMIIQAEAFLQDDI